tara:strand:- start:7669 stop:8112 length:444 start_codon:yes stop_codon:yes gene_type:complete
MALKGEREVLATNVYFTATAGKDMERGIVLVAGAAGKADKHGAIGHPAPKPVGLLLDDVEDLDFTTRPQVFVRNVVPRGSEISLLTQGRVKTNKIVSAVTVAAGEKAYLADNGEVTNVVGSGLVVGHFESAKDADGYARLWVDIEGA